MRSERGDQRAWRWPHPLAVLLGAVITTAVGCLDFTITPGTLACVVSADPPCPDNWVCVPPTMGDITGRCFPALMPTTDSAVVDAGADTSGPSDTGRSDTGQGADAIVQRLDSSGPGVPGFGDPCEPSAPKCPGQMACVGPDQDKGFCSLGCDKLGAPCPGAPPNTVAGCVYTTTSSDHYCGFFCRVKDDQGQVHAYDCPGETVCASEEDPPGQRSCVPIS